MRLTRGRTLLWGGMLAMSMGIVMVGSDPAARGVDKQVLALQKLCESPGAPHRKAMAIHELCELGSEDAHDALEALSGSEDDRTAILALAALGREGFTGASAKLQTAMGDTGRSHAVRAGAMAAFCERAKREEKAWSEVSGTLDQKAGSDQRLKDQVAALKGKLWSTGGGE